MGSMNPEGSTADRELVAGDSVLRFKLTVAFDGSDYAGWQVQRFGTGVQEKLEQALQKLFGMAVRLHSSSRTDAGVHALGMVAHLDLPRERFRMAESKLALAINANLPEDIRVLSALRVEAGFHARFGATGKQYRYFLWNHRASNPLLRKFVWHVPATLRLDAMRAAAAGVVGRHDFRSFAANRGYEVADTVREVWRCNIRRSGHLWVFVLEADGFLYKMCRGLVGTLVQVGQGLFPIEAVSTMLTERDRRVAGMSAPACGLVLWKVYYGGRPDASRSGSSAVGRDGVRKE